MRVSWHDTEGRQWPNEGSAADTTQLDLPAVWTAVPQAPTVMKGLNTVTQRFFGCANECKIFNRPINFYTLSSSARKVAPNYLTPIDVKVGTDRIERDNPSY
jgi:hypothetical protein